MTDSVIRPLHLGTLIRDKSIFTYLKNMGQRIEVPIIAWYIEGNGYRILVDTGGHDPGKIDLHGPYSRSAQQDPVAALKAWGVRPEEIDILILTHLHWDHASNIDLFPKARFIVQREELRYAAAPLEPHRWAYDLYPALSIKNKRFEVIDGDAQIAEGVSVHLTPGHSPGLQGVSVRTTKKIYFIAGDSVPLMEMWNARKIYGVSHWPGALHVDLEIYMKSLKRIESLGDAILPGHDTCVFEQREYR
jgi:glyoxylase-like metal-dependent hydrolase (beta-lactamase superfamily II)